MAMPKKERVITVKYLDDKGNFIAGEKGDKLTITVKGVTGEITIYPELLSEKVRKQALFHGIKQKLSDAAAKTDATVQEKFNLMLDQKNVLTADDSYDEELMDWFKNRVGGGGYSVAKLAQAYVRAEATKGNTASLDMITVALTKATPEKRAEFANKPQIKTALAEIRLEELTKAAEDADDDLLDGLFDEEETNAAD